MAEESGQEKTEQATPKRLQKAREEGQVARSRELNTTAVLLAGGAGLIMFGGNMAAALQRLASDNFQLQRQTVFDTGAMFAHLGSAFSEIITHTLPFVILMVAAALLAPASLGGWNFSTKALRFKGERINPLSGIKRMFSVNSLVELLKAIAKVSVVVLISVLLLNGYSDSLLAIRSQSVESAISHVLSILGWTFLLMSCSMILIAAVDIPYQLWDHAKKLKMTVQQVKDEMKETDGRPEVRGRIKQLQRELAQSRMMSKVPEADVVITNPTHYAVALKYDPNNADAPVLLAKGSDLIAQRIREIASSEGVPLVSLPPLARAVFHSTEVDQQIPVPLYLAVAQVLAYVFQLKRYNKGLADKPETIQVVDIPEEYRY